MRIRLLLLLLFSLPLAAPTLAQSDDVADWTYMQYFAMDNDLEGQAFGDLVEMAAVGSSADVNIVAQVDRIDGYETRFGDWTDTRRFYLEQFDQPDYSFEAKLEAVLALIYSQPEVSEEELRGEIRQLIEADPETVEQLLNAQGLSLDEPAKIEAVFSAFGLGLEFDVEPVEVLGERNMGAAESLVDFIVWAVENYPAEKYALVISTHGAGWPGNGPDVTDNEDMLHLPELVAALEEARAMTGIGQFEIVGFDACLMGQLEVYHALAPHTRYVIAAEEVIPGQGWEYTEPFRRLTEDPSMDGLEFGQRIVDSYMDYYGGPGARTQVDLHLIDAGATGAVVEALDMFVDVVGGDNAEILSALGVARNNAQPFGGSVTDVLSGSYNGAQIYSSVDLIDFMGKLAAQPSVDETTATAAQAVIDAAQTAIAYSRADDYLPGANGMALYFPLNSTLAELPALVLPDHVDYTDSNPGVAQWAGFLTALHDTIDNTLSPDNLGVEITQVWPADSAASIYDPPVVVFDTVGEGIANIVFSAVLTQDDGRRIMLDYSPLVIETVLPDGQIVREYPNGIAEGNQFAWNVEMPVINDGSTAIPALVFAANTGSTGAVNGVFERDAEQTSASILFDLDTRQSVGIYGISPEGGTPFEIMSVPGDTFTPYWFYFDDAGELVSEPASDFLTLGVAPLSYDFAPALSGSYDLSIRIEDLAGNSQLDVTEVLIDNEGLDTALRGFKMPDLGINFLYPWGWTDPSLISGEDGDVSTLYVTDPAEEIAIYVTMSDQSLEKQVSAMAELNASQPNGSVSEIASLEMPSGEAASFTYEYEGESGPRAGTVIVIHVPDNEATYTFDLDAATERADEAAEVLDVLVGSLSFFTPLE